MKTVRKLYCFLYHFSLWMTVAFLGWQLSNYIYKQQLTQSELQEVKTQNAALGKQVAELRKRPTIVKRILSSPPKMDIITGSGEPLIPTRK